MSLEKQIEWWQSHDVTILGLNAIKNLNIDNLKVAK